jgi:ADP-ribosyl-[dinitrogen reductase] hydrolase
MTIEKARGTLLGLACGDALGRPVEFKSQRAIREEYGTLTEMVGNGTWNKPAGTVTDDTD